ncbi:UDP-glucuronate decarboxylase [Shimia isoporae]|uniref:UDP-glucuronate decarboxylase n=1 Tax=Shimia isoporae TaxID=647720 RepID=A0A4R1NVF4_9RHOB|nr:UDP-glucuronic acid decarboxylase family protein [Shimia isoporae]TCL09052.1 UDP-glucuronate decarboxylase [Shimia isoporae]
MKVCVTGAAGFLGSHLCDRLLSEGHAVTGIDNYLTGFPKNLAQAKENPNFTLLKHDVEQPMSGEFDLVYHLASPASPPMYQKDPIATARINFLGTLNALELARRSNARFLLASTSETYGDPKVHPQPETYAGNVNQTGPRACYDEGKRIAETLAYDFARQYGLETRVVRIFNTFGPRMHPEDGRVVTSFVYRALRGEDLTVFGDGSQTRSFCYFSDLIEGLVRMMNATSVNGPVNLGNPEEITIAELAQLIVEMTNSGSKLTFKPLPQDDPRQRKPDITKAKAVLGWEPQVTMREGLQRTIETMSAQPEAQLLKIRA